MGLLTKIVPYLLFIIFIILCNIILPSTSAISDKRLCYDPHCEVIVSVARTVTPYYSNDPDILSFDANVHVDVFSKSAGIRKDLWGVKINGKRGYAPIKLLHEKKVIQRELQHEVDTELSTNNEINSNNDNENSKVFPSYEVIHGTTVYDAVEDETKKNINYATQVPNDTATQETPVLTVHPNQLSTSEATAFQSSSSVENIDLENNIVTTPTSVLEDVEQSTIKENSIDNLIDNKQPVEKLDNVEQVETEELNVVIEKNNTDVGVDDIQNEDINKDENIMVEMEKKNPDDELLDNSKNVEEINNDIVDKKIEESVIEISETSEDMVANAFQKVSALFDSFTTTETPQIEPQVEINEPIDDNKLLENIIEVINVTTEIPVQEIINDDTQNNVVTEINKTEEFENNNESVDVASELIDNNNNDNIIQVAEDIVNDNSTSHGQPDIYKTDDLTGPSQNVIESKLNINEFPGNRNLLNVGDLNQNEDVSTENIETTTETYISTPIEEVQQTVQPTQESEINNDKIVEIESPVVDIEIPVTEMPTVEVPVTELPITEVPVTEEPITEVPITEVPITETPITQVPVIEVPVTEVPTTEVPVLEEIVTEIPYQDIDTIVNETSSINDETENIIYPVEEEIKIKQPERLPQHFYGKHVHPEQPAEKSQIKSEFTVVDDDIETIDPIKFTKNYWETFSYIGLTAFTTLIFSLGYYYIENTRRDGQLIAKINKLEQKLIVATKECSDMDEILKKTTIKLDAFESKSFDSNEIVASLKADLESANQSKIELEDQVAALEKDLEVATDSGLELERMLREFLESKNTENPITKSVEDLQTRLNAQQAANESLTNSLQLKIQENESLVNDLALATQKCEQLEVETTRLNEELKNIKQTKKSVEEKLSLKVSKLEEQIKILNNENTNNRIQLNLKQIELDDVIEQSKASKTDLKKLFDLSKIKAEAIQVAEERDELKIKLSEIEGAHQSLEEHMKIIKEEVVSLGEQCKLAEKEKKDAETKLEVLSKFFKEKEAERQKEEALWLNKQGEVSSTIDRLHTLQNEVQIYKQQIETLKHEIIDQEKEYKLQITNLEAKSHEQWVIARQNERRLEESKAESAQLRNRLTMMERNINDTDSDIKVHRMETNGDTTYMGADTSSSPIMFSGPGNIPPPPFPSYFMGPPLPPFMPPLPGMPLFDVGQRPPPLGGRLSSPPPMPHPSSGRYDNHGTPPPPLSPSSNDFMPLPPPSSSSFHKNIHHSFGNDRNQPPHLPGPPWGDDLLPPLPHPPRNNSGFHPFHRDQRNRDHRDSLHSSGESLDKSHRSSNV
ncbi:transport and Golgi organization protein 1 [Aphidius gifuensis]|uniref:transport and Golgi organization protein 1 n=1 Tax=Aphidius gifuensis TaxID=684658 RepID=UPI001CDD659E|nr:transport and Golgi organization protein 1 [Aphidius gifuensis]